jgi:hypothetical protein
LRARIRTDYGRACAGLYWIKPRSVVDPETGEPLRDAENGLLPFHLYPEQRRTTEIALGQQARGEPVRIVKVKCRQSGDSTWAASWTFHHTYWSRNTRALTVAHHDTTTASLYDMHQTFYNELPPELQLPLKKLNRKELATERPHANALMAQTAGFIDIGHGLTIQHAHLSEIDLWPVADTALEGILEAIPLAPGTSVIIESKAQGTEGWLYGFWKESKRGMTGFTPVFTPWHLIPEYRLAVPADFELQDEEREWVRQFGITPAQVVWYRAKRNLAIAKEPWGGERRHKSSYPFTDDEAFQSSGLCVFPDVVLRRLHEGVRHPSYALRLVQLPFPGQFEALEEDPHPKAPQLWVWEDPDPDQFYAIGVDISDGVGETESVVSVCKYPGYVQVAEWASKHSSVEDTAYAARWIAEHYGGANTLVIPEVNRNGSLILYLLSQLPGSYAIFRWRYLDRPHVLDGDHAKLGWETNFNTKKILVQVANMIYLRGQGEIASETLYDQMTRCIDVAPQRWATVKGQSDRIIAWLIAQIGAYLDFEGGDVGGIVSDRRPEHKPEVDVRWKEPNSHDPDLDELFEQALPVGGPFTREDRR